MKAKRHPRDSKNSSGSETNERAPHLKSHHPNLKRKASNNLKSQRKLHQKRRRKKTKVRGRTNPLKTTAQINLKTRRRKVVKALATV